MRHLLKAEIWTSTSCKMGGRADRSCGPHRGRVKKKLTIMLTFSMALVALIGCGPSKDWSGQWHLDEAKSTIPGPTFTISLTPAGTYRLDDGILTYSFACDGNKYPTASNRSISCIQKNPSVIDSTSTVNGIMVETAHWELSVDRTLLSVTHKVSRESGAAMKSTEKIFARTANSLGFIGGWKNTRPFGDRPRVLLLALSGRTLHWVRLESGNFADIPLDGSYAVVRGQSVPPGTTIALKPSGSREFLTQQKVQGRIVNQGCMKLARDGQTLIEEYWVPGNSQRAELVYDRQ
jgi:hypothetical protein